MTLTLFAELEKVLGKECMKNLCETYLIKYAIDNSGARVWKDCSGEEHPKETRTPPKIVRKNPQEFEDLHS